MHACVRVRMEGGQGKCVGLFRQGFGESPALSAHEAMATRRRDHLAQKWPFTGARLRVTPSRNKTEEKGLLLPLLGATT